MYELAIISSFSSAHNLRGYEGACENLHGHNWRVEARVIAEKPGPMEMVIDFKELKAETKRILDGLDHRYLNEVPPFDKLNPTAENIARFIYTELGKAVNGKGVRVSKVRVWESDNAAAAYFE